MSEEDARFGEPVDLDAAVPGLTAVLKALVIRAGGRIELTNSELERAERALVRVDGTTDLLTMQVVSGKPPHRPRRARDWPPPEPAE